MIVVSSSVNLSPSLDVAKGGAEVVPFARTSEVLNSVEGEAISCISSEGKLRLAWKLGVSLGFLRLWEFDRYGGVCSVPFL